MSKHETSQPLVSIIVITYNSSKYVLETLESAKAQTYQNIELIISDDASQDNTIEICKNWLEKNINRFKRAEILAGKKNIGISGNCNKGLYQANGEWVKFIAGDDTLFPNCIEVFNSFILSSNKRDSFCFSDIEYFVADRNYGFRKKVVKQPVKLMNLEPRGQYKQLLKKACYIKAPGSYIHKDTLISLGGFNENYPFLEDYPLWVKVTKIDYKLVRVPHVLVRYRIHSESIFNSYSNNLENGVKFFESIYKYYNDIIFKSLLKERLYIHYFHFKILYLNQSQEMLGKKFFINTKFLKVLDPLYILNTAKRKVIALKSFISTILSRLVSK